MKIRTGISTTLTSWTSCCMHSTCTRCGWTSRIYKNLISNPPNTDICPCLVDVENNGIYFNLRWYLIAQLVTDTVLNAMILYFCTNEYFMPIGTSQCLPANQSWHVQHREQEDAKRRQEAARRRLLCNWPFLFHRLHKTTETRCGRNFGRRERRCSNDDPGGFCSHLSGMISTYHSKTYWVNLFNGFAEMTDPISSDLALFLYCMLK